MSKIQISAALNHVIGQNHLHHQVLQQNGAENYFTNPLPNHINNCQSQYPYNNSIIDLVKFYQGQNIDWALEAKHYSPHQNGQLNRNNPQNHLGYLQYSLGGPIKDVLKLVDCGFQKFYILQIQTQILNFTINHNSDYQNLTANYPFLATYLGNNVQAATNNIARIQNQNRIVNLINYSRQQLDTNLLYNHIDNVVNNVNGTISVRIHLLISGPFYQDQIRQQLNNNFNIDQPLVPQINNNNPTWNANVSINSINDQ